jgi:PilZ domain
MDRRRHDRYDLIAPVAFFWKDLQRSRTQGKGFMRDLSVGGLFVMTDTLPPADTTLRLEIHLEFPRSDSAVVILAKGQVCRVELSDLVGVNSGFAASTKRLRLHNIRSRGEETLGTKSPEPDPGKQQQVLKLCRAKEAVKP